MRTLACAGILASLTVWAAEKKGIAKAAWPPKEGIKTPGIQIPFSSLKPEADVALPGVATGVLFADRVYVAVREGDALLPVVLKTNQPETLIEGLPRPCGGLVSAFNSIWAASCGEPKLSRFDTKTKKLESVLAAPAQDGTLTMAATGDSLWLLSDKKTTLSRIDPEEKRITAETRLPAGCSSLLSSEGSLWVNCAGEDKVLRIHIQTNLVEKTVEVPGEPVALAAGEGSIWALCARDGKVVRIDPKTNKSSATIELKSSAAGGSIAVAEGSVWVSAPNFPITRIDPVSEKVAQQFAGEGWGTLYAGAGSIWLAPSGQKVLRRFDPKRIRATLAE